MSKWTEAELSALHASGRDYQKFGDMTGFSKSYDAWEVKRRRPSLYYPARVYTLSIGRLRFTLVVRS